MPGPAVAVGLADAAGLDAAVWAVNCRELIAFAEDPEPLVEAEGEVVGEVLALTLGVGLVEVPGAVGALGDVLAVGVADPVGGVAEELVLLSYMTGAGER